MFLTQEQIAADILANHMPPADKNTLAAYLRSDLIMLHHTMGRWIRNAYDLWDAANPNTMLGYEPLIENGCDCNPKHPDAVSMDVIYMMWEQLQ